MPQVTQQVVNVQALKTNLTSILSAAKDNFQVDSVMQIIGATSSVINSGGACSGDKTACSGLRETLLDYLSQTSAIQDASPGSVQQQATLLNSLTTNTEQLTTGRSQLLAYDLLSTITATASMTGVTPTAASAIGSTISSLFSVFEDNQQQESFPVRANDAASRLSSSVDNLLRAAWAGLSPGEDPLQIQQPNFNTSNSVNYAYSLQNKTLAAPGVNSSVVLPRSGIGALFPSASATDTISTGITSMKNVHNANKTAPLKSNVLRFSVSMSETGSLQKRGRRLVSLYDTAASLKVSLETTSANIVGVGSAMFPL